MIRKNDVKSIGFKKKGYASIEKKLLNPWLDSDAPLVVIEKQGNSNLLGLLGKRLQQIGKEDRLLILDKVDFNFIEIMEGKNVVYLKVNNDQEVEQLKSLLVKLETTIDSYFYEEVDITLPYCLVFNGFDDGELNLSALNYLVEKTNGKKLITPNKANLMPLKRNDQVCIGVGKDNKLKYLKFDSNNAHYIHCTGVFHGDIIANRLCDGGVIFIDSGETHYLDELEECLSKLNRLNDLFVFDNDSVFDLNALIFEEKIIYINLKKEELANWLPAFSYNFRTTIEEFDKIDTPTVTNSLILNYSYIDDVISEVGLGTVFDTLNTTRDALNLFLFTDSHKNCDHVMGNCNRSVFYALRNLFSDFAGGFTPETISDHQETNWGTVYQNNQNGIFTESLINDLNSKKNTEMLEEVSRSILEKYLTF